MNIVPGYASEAFVKHTKVHEKSYVPELVGIHEVNKMIIMIKSCIESIKVIYNLTH